LKREHAGEEHEGNKAMRKGQGEIWHAEVLTKSSLEDNACCAVASGILPDVKGGVPPPGTTPELASHSERIGQRSAGRRRHGSTAGETPAATSERTSTTRTACL
jgi:hypothetical protein